MLNEFLIALMAAVIGYVYARILIQPEHILGPFWAWLKRKLTRHDYYPEIRELPEEIARLKGKEYESVRVDETREHWLLKPLGGCELCTAGQLCLWIFLYHWLILKLYLQFNSIFEAILNMIFTICLAILLTRLLALLVERLSR